MKPLPLLCALCAALLLTACSGSHESAGAAAAAQATPWVAVARGEVGVEGGLLQVRPAVAGMVQALPVDDGAQVKAGQVLVQLDAGAAHIAERLAEADRAQADAQQAELQAGRSALSERVRRLAAASAADAAPAQELADARAALAQLDARIAAAKAGVQAAQARLAAARYQLGLYTLRAPLAGTVIRRQVQVGARVSPQDPAPLLELLPVRPLVVRAELDESYAARVQVGMRAEVVLDGGGDGKWPAQVVRLGQVYGPVTLGPQHDQPDDARDLPVLLRLDAPGLHVGQRVLVRILPASAAH